MNSQPEAKHDALLYRAPEGLIDLLAVPTIEERRTIRLPEIDWELKRLCGMLGIGTCLPHIHRERHTWRCNPPDGVMTYSVLSYSEDHRTALIAVPWR